ncbi:MAG: S8/S53 family peptidase [Ferruginibacter sp.]
MNARLTVYVKPGNKIKSLPGLKSFTGISNELVFFSEDSKFLSWVGESDITVSSQKEAFELERAIQQIEGVEDAEVITEESSEEEDINERFDHFNGVINLSKPTLPDPFWYHRSIDMDGALEYAAKEFAAGRGSFDKDASKFSIAMLDTGYTNHPETASVDREHGKNFMRRENPDDPIDTLESTRPLPIRWGGHGTSCSSLIIGADSVIAPENRIPRENTFFDDRVNGLLPKNINLVPFRVSRNILSFGSNMAEGINYVSRKTDISVISMSHASLLNRRIYHAAIREAYEKGIIFIAAPGSHVFASRKVLTYPAKYPETIAPAASTVDNEPWKLTHGGPEVALCAPGFEIYIPFPFKTKDLQVGYVYKWSEGSSFAVPIVATAAALWKMHHGEKLDSFSGIEQIEMFRHIIKKTATPFANPDNQKLYGAGIINFKKMLESPLEPAAVPKENFMAVMPEQIFVTNKKEASFIRELSYLRVKQLAFKPSKKTNDIDYFYEEGSESFKDWMTKRLQNVPDKGNTLKSIIESNL